MQSFLNWMKENKLESPSITDTAPAEENIETQDTEENTTDENRVRTGYSANYPDAYVSGQYPEKYFNPSKANADVEAENMKDKKVVTPKDTEVKENK